MKRPFLLAAYLAVCAPMLISVGAARESAPIESVIGNITVEVARPTVSKMTVTFMVDDESGQGLLNSDDFLPFARFLALPDGFVPQINIADVTLSQPDSRPSASPDRPIAREVILVGEPFKYSDFQLVPVAFNPIIQAGSGRVTVSEATVTIDLPPSDVDLSRLPRQIRRMLRGVLLNPPRRDDGGGEDGGTYIYAYPDDNRVAEALAELVLWRRQQGFSVRELRIPEWADADFIYHSIQDIHRQGPPVSYICLAGDQGGQFSVPALIRGTSDYVYGILSDNGPLPDAAVGRLSFNSIGELQRMVVKILNYEREADFEDDDWLNRAAVAAGNPQSGYSTILVSRWLRDFLLRRGFARVDTFFWTMNGGVESYMEAQFARGNGFITYRGWTGMEDWTAREAGRLNNRRLPVALFLGCNTGDFDGPGAGFTEALLRADGGAIGAVGSVGSQSRVGFNNALLAGYFRGVIDGGVDRLGWMLNRAKLEMFAAYGAVGREWVASHAYWTNLMGDPATPIWRAMPQAADIDAPDRIPIGSEAVQVTVTTGGQPAAGVLVGFYQENTFSSAATTNQNGVAMVHLDRLRLAPGRATITVSGGGVLPVTRQIQAVAPQRRMQYLNHFILDDANEPRQGNGDGEANPFETILLTAMLRNIGFMDVPPGSRYNLISEDEESAEIVQGQFILNQSVAPGGVVQAEFLVRLTNRFPDATPIPFLIRVTSDENEWEESFTLTGVAPRWTIARITGNLPLNANAEDTLNVYLTNLGQDTLLEATGILTSPSEFIDVLQGEYAYPEILPGDTAGQWGMFRVLVSADIPFDEAIPFELNLTDAADYQTTLHFTLNSTPLPTVYPTGPDAYGYWAIDDGDTTSNLRPEFVWVEINPRLGGRGTDTGLLDQGEDDDKSIAMDLPFNFRYYGRDWDQITICTNGWAALGDQAAYVDFRNTPIGVPQGPLAQICPFWDDLYQPGLLGGVFTWYDAANHRFFVEWYRMRRYIGPGGPGASETFQLVLLDPRWHPTATGDGDILFYYQEVTIEGRADGNGTPYPTVGLGNPEDDGGIEYGFWNRWASGAAPVERGMAIRFATSPSRNFGVARGTVHRLADGQPLEGAVVRSSSGGWAMTDAEGAFRIPNVIAGMPFTLTASLAGYNDRISGELIINRPDSVQVRLDLTRPTAEIEPQAVGDTLDANAGAEHQLILRNQGDGELNFTVQFEAPEMNLFQIGMINIVDDADDPDEPWQRLFGWDATDSTGDNRLLGAAFTGDNFIISGGSNGEPRNYFYYADRIGVSSGRSLQPCESQWGMHDLAWDGRRLYGGCEDIIYVMTPEGQVIRTLSSPLMPPRGLAVDPASGEIWVANDGDPIHRLSGDGEILARYPHRLRPYGLAWHPADGEGFNLYIFSADGSTNLAVSKLNPQTGEIKFVSQLDLRQGDRAGGCELTLRWDSRRWTMVTLIQNSDGDRVELIDAGLNLAWVTAQPMSGTVPPEDAQEITVTLNSAELDGGVYRADMVIRHNADGGEIWVPVSLYVEPELAGAPGTAPVRFQMAEIYPNPVNSGAMVHFSIPAAVSASLSVVDISGRQVLELFDGRIAAGDHQWSVDAGILPSGVYMMRLITPANVISRKFVVVK